MMDTTEKITYIKVRKVADSVKVKFIDINNPKNVYKIPLNGLVKKTKIRGEIIKDYGIKTMEYISYYMGDRAKIID